MQTSGEARREIANVFANRILNVVLGRGAMPGIDEQVAEPRA